VVEANESSIAVLAITTDISVASRGRYPMTELDQQVLFRALTKWNKVIDRADEIAGALRFNRLTRPYSAGPRRALDDRAQDAECTISVLCASSASSQGSTRDAGSRQPFCRAPLAANSTLLSEPGCAE